MPGWRAGAASPGRSRTASPPIRSGRRWTPPLAYDPACRVNPPLASRADALALLAGVADGSIDAIATDHAPHPRERKGVEFGAAAPGMIGLETALSLGLAAVEAGSLELVRLLAALSTAPAALIGETRIAGRRIGRRPGRLRSGRPLAGRGIGPRVRLVEHAAARDGAARGGADDRGGRADHLSRRARRHRLTAPRGATGGRMWDHAHRPCRSARTRNSIRMRARLRVLRLAGDPVRRPPLPHPDRPLHPQLAGLAAGRAPLHRHGPALLHQHDQRLPASRLLRRSPPGPRPHRRSPPVPTRVINTEPPPPDAPDEPTNEGEAE